MLTCFGGCTPQHQRGAQRVRRVAEALGLKPSDLFSGASQPAAARRVVATYDYHHLDGTLLGQKIRYAPKSFCWQQYSPDVGPYHLPDLIGVRTVILTEGEKGCDRQLRSAAAHIGHNGAGADP